jgi:hypothetical protein
LTDCELVSEPMDAKWKREGKTEDVACNQPV